MNNKAILLFVLVMLKVAVGLDAQNLRITGNVTDSVSNKFIPGAVVVVDNAIVFTRTHTAGNIKCDVKKGLHQITCKFLGYNAKTNHFVILKDSNINFSLGPSMIAMKEITVFSDASAKRITDVQGGAVSLTRKEITSLPVMLGESDFFKAMQLLPGVQNSGEGDAAIYVRGGSNDQNLILLDGAVVYNPMHLLGFYSVFNSDIVKDVTLIKSGMPAEYGNRISSVIDFNTRPDMTAKMKTFGNFGLISARLGFIAPILNTRSSMYVAMRKTYLNVLLSGMRAADIIKGNSILHKSGYDFYDINAGITLNFTTKDKVYLTFYKGKDDFSLNANVINFQSNMNWGNNVGSLTWTHLFNGSFLMEHRVFVSGYNYQMNFTQNQFLFNLTSDILDEGYKNKISYFTGIHKIKAGIEIIHHRITPNSSRIEAQDGQLVHPEQNHYYSFENSLYISDELKISDKVSLIGGLRANAFLHIGPYFNYQCDKSGNVSDTIHYSGSEVIKTYTGLEPRFALRYLLSDDASVKFSYTINNQYIHLVNASSVTFPTDFWIPSTKLIQPQHGYQLAAGYYRNLTSKNIECSFEVYYKHANHQLEFNNSIIHVFDNTPTDENLIFGLGRSYGAELLIKKTQGNLSGWIGYTLSRTERKFEEIEHGRWFAAKYDRTHDISCVINYTLNNRWSFSTVFVFATGSAYTPVVGRYFIEKNVINQYGAYNSARMPDYHRLDIAATYIMTKSDTKESKLIFSIYNVYNRLNPFFIYPQASGNIINFTLNVEPKEVAIFPILPSISWQFLY